MFSSIFYKKMMRFPIKQNGQALPITLCLLAIGGLTISASLNLSTSALKGTQAIQEDVNGIYAAGSGVEYNLWAIKYGNATLTQLPQQVNGMTVNISTHISDSFSTVFINNLATGGHSDWYSVSTNVTSLGGNSYNFTINVTTSADAKNNARLQQLGAVLPVGYTYVVNSTSLNPSGNITPGNPTSTGYDNVGSQWLRWDWSGGAQPTIQPSNTYTESFNITGNGSLNGYYAWIMGNSQDIGVVGQITGLPTTINATAIRPDGTVVARIYCYALTGSGGIYVLSWRVVN